MQRQQSYGFSLVELSIVLVILGLLVGGILSGRSLIEAAELRTVGVDMERYLAATYSFKEKYHGLPGDLINAEAFWGEQEADPATCKTTPSTDRLTCNGDGDGRVYPYSSHSNEGFRYWQHLSNAGMIAGSYTGVSSSAGDYGALPGENAPTTNGGNAVITLDWQPAYTGNWEFFDGRYGNTFVVAGNGFGAWEIFTPTDMYNLEEKFDDGKPGLGRIRTRHAGHMPDCVTAVDPQDAEYILTNDTPSCFFHYIWE